MDTKDLIRWIVAAFFWAAALFVLYFNISRHFKNQKTPGKRISGVPFLFSIFCFLGAAASPLSSTWIFLPVIIFEIPATTSIRSVYGMENHTLATPNDCTKLYGHPAITKPMVYFTIQTKRLVYYLLENHWRDTYNYHHLTLE